MRKSIESRIEKSKKEEKEKTVIERLKEIKKKEEEIARQDKTGTPWHAINPEELIPEAQELFDFFEKGEYETAKGLLEAVREKTKEMEKSKVKDSNEGLANLLDDKIIEKITQKESEGDKEKDNY